MSESSESEKTKKALRFTSDQTFMKKLSELISDTLNSDDETGAKNYAREIAYDNIEDFAHKELNKIIPPCDSCASLRKTCSRRSRFVNCISCKKKNCLKRKETFVKCYGYRKIFCDPDPILCKECFTKQTTPCESCLFLHDKIGVVSSSVSGTDCKVLDGTYSVKCVTCQKIFCESSRGDGPKRDTCKGCTSICHSCLNRNMYGLCKRVSGKDLVSCKNCEYSSCLLDDRSFCLVCCKLIPVDEK
jgi:hypothetical protein